MSKRNERRAAEREARKAAYQQLRHSQQQDEKTKQEPAPKSNPSVSEAQLAANRANAKFSTGAVTPEGRAKSCLNALKTGLTGKTVLLPNEDAAHYRQTLDAAIETFQPAADEELALVQELVDCNWRLDRIQRLESAILLKGHLEFANKYEDHAPAERALLIDADAYIKYEKQLRNLNVQEARLRRLLDKSRAELSRLQSIRRREEQRTGQTHPQPRTENGFEFASRPASPECASSIHTSPHATAAQSA